MQQAISVAYNPIRITTIPFSSCWYDLKDLETLKEPHGMAEQCVDTSDLDVTLDHWTRGSIMNMIMTMMLFKTSILCWSVVAQR